MMLIEPCLAPNGESAEDLGIRSTDCAEFFQAKLAELLPDYSTLDIEIDGAVAPGAKYHRRNSVNESGLWDAIAPETKERYGLD